MESKHFNSATELIKYLGISRPTFYKRAKRLDISTTKSDYSDDELKALLKPLLRKDNSDNTNKTNDKAVNLLSEQLANVNETVNEQREQLKKKDKQISELHTLLDQQQRLALDLQKQLSAPLEDTDLRDNIETKKSFWHRLFG